MKRDDFHISQITIKDTKSTMSPTEYAIWKVNWDRFWDKLIGDAFQQIAEDKKKGIKFKPTPKSELIKRSFEMARELDIKLPGSFGRFFYDDIYFIKEHLEYELRLKIWVKNGCKVVFEPPRLPSSEIIARIVERAKEHKARGLRSFRDWEKNEIH